MAGRCITCLIKLNCCPPRPACALQGLDSAFQEAAENFLRSQQNDFDRLIAGLSEPLVGEEEAAAVCPFAARWGRRCAYIMDPCVHSGGTCIYTSCSRRSLCIINIYICSG